MRFRGLWDKIVDYSVIIVIAICGIVGITITFLGLSNIYLLIVSILGFIFIAIKDIKEKHTTKEKEGKEEIEKELTDEKLDNIDKKVTEENKELEYKKKLMSEFLRCGVVKEDDIIDSLNKEPFVIVYHFNKSLPRGIEQFFPEKKKIMISILENLGFVPVGRFHGSYFFHVISANSLPRPLDSIPQLEAYIRRKMNIKWKKTWEEMEKNNKRLYQKYKDEKEERVNLSYFLGKIFPSNLSIGYLNFHTFDDRFLSYYSKFTNLKKIKIDKKKLSDLISLASVNFFIGLVEPKDRKIILQNESKIRRDFGIKNLLDYESITEERWVEELTKIFPSELEKVTKDAKIIFSTTKKFVPVIKDYL